MKDPYQTKPKPHWDKYVKELRSIVTEPALFNKIIELNWELLGAERKYFIDEFNSPPPPASEQREG